MQIVLLAAGMGTRLKEKTVQLPKSLLPLNGKPILHHLLKSLEGFVLESVLIVGGFQFEMLRASLPSSPLNLQLIRNDEYMKGNLVSFLKAKDHLKGTFCIMNADHLFSRNILSRAYEGFTEAFSDSTTDSITGICDSDRTLTDDDMKVKARYEGKRAVLDHMDKKLIDFDFGYIGMTLVPASKREKYLIQAQKVVSEEGDHLHVESVLNRLAASQEQIELRDVSGSVWLEVDTQSDLERAEELIGKMDFPVS